MLKLVAILCLGFVAFTAKADPCPNLNGSYVFFEGTGSQFTERVVQNGCQDISPTQQLIGLRNQIKLDGNEVGSLNHIYSAYIRDSNAIVMKLQTASLTSGQVYMTSVCSYSLDVNTNLVRHCQTLNAKSEVISDIVDSGRRI